MLENTGGLFTMIEQPKLCFSPLSIASSVLVSPNSSFSIPSLPSPFSPFPPPRAVQVQHSRSTRQNRGDWVGRDVEVVGSYEREEEEGARWVEARREG